MEASVSAMTKETEVFARLRDFVITNVDPKTVHKKVKNNLGFARMLCDPCDP